MSEKLHYLIPHLKDISGNFENEEQENNTKKVSSLKYIINTGCSSGPKQKAYFSVTPVCNKCSTEEKNCNIFKGKGQNPLSSQHKIDKKDLQLKVAKATDEVISTIQNEKQSKIWDPYILAIRSALRQYQKKIFYHVLIVYFQF